MKKILVSVLFSFLLIFASCSSKNNVDLSFPVSDFLNTAFYSNNEVSGSSTVTDKSQIFELDFKISGDETFNKKLSGTIEELAAMEIDVPSVTIGSVINIKVSVLYKDSGLEYMTGKLDSYKIVEGENVIELLLVYNNGKVTGKIEDVTFSINGSNYSESEKAYLSTAKGDITLYVVFDKEINAEVQWLIPGQTKAVSTEKTWKFNIYELDGLSFDSDDKCILNCFIYYNNKQNMKSFVLAIKKSEISAELADLTCDTEIYSLENKVYSINAYCALEGVSYVWKMTEVKSQKSFDVSEFATLSESNVSNLYMDFSKDSKKFTDLGLDVTTSISVTCYAVKGNKENIVSKTNVVNINQ